MGGWHLLPRVAAQAVHSSMEEDAKLVSQRVDRSIHAHKDIFDGLGACYHCLAPQAGPRMHQGIRKVGPLHAGICLDVSTGSCGSFSNRRPQGALGQGVCDLCSRRCSTRRSYRRFELRWCCSSMEEETIMCAK